jgi:hypothetical protein
MQPTDFELRHPILVHQLLVAAAALTYLFDPVDVVWRLVKDAPAPHAWERSLLLLAALCIALGASLCTWTRANLNAFPHRFASRLRYCGDLAYSIGLASLVPLPGFLILVIGEALRVY